MWVEAPPLKERVDADSAHGSPNENWARSWEVTGESEILVIGHTAPW